MAIFLSLMNALQFRKASQQLVVLIFPIFLSLPVLAQDSLRTISELKKLSIQDLMNLEVTSVAKSPQKLSESASAIQVITREDIVRSGATSLPEALRLAPNLQVAQFSSGAWIISARGFNTVFANKLLVLIDGRSVYTPLFGGVLWELQNVLLEDVERIEIISGPGGTLWGPNAVNGVINVITKRAADTKGIYASVATGNGINNISPLTASNMLKSNVAARFGGSIAKKIAYRAYAMQFVRGATFLPDRQKNNDDWKNTQFGFRMDYDPTSADQVTVQGDVYGGNRRTTPSSNFDGESILARWTRRNSASSDFSLQVYYDRYYRDDPTSIGNQMYTLDFDFQKRRVYQKIHQLLWGVGYRFVDDRVFNRTTLAGLTPEQRNLPLYTAFIQDEIALKQNLKVTLGTKLLHNVFTGFEYQPSIRAAWQPKLSATLWGALSRAVRTPSRFDVDYKLPIEPQPPTVASVAGGPDFNSEIQVAYEIGYRVQPTTTTSFSLSLFYNNYNNVYSVETLPGTLTYQIQNGSEAEAKGAEFSGVYQLTSWWRLRGGFTYLITDVWAKPGREHDPSYLTNDAKHHALLQSIVDLPENFELDVVARYFDYLPQTFATVQVPAYFTFDARISYTFKAVQLSIVGQNLGKDYHAEFGSGRIPRSFYASATCRF